MAKPKNTESELHRAEFDLRCTENLRRGLAAEGAWDLVLRADAIIADGRKRVEQIRSRLNPDSRQRRGT